MRDITKVTKILKTKYKFFYPCIIIHKATHCKKHRRPNDEVSLIRFKLSSHVNTNTQSKHECSHLSKILMYHSSV